jgi:hypothetical protein
MNVEHRTLNIEHRIWMSLHSVFLINLKRRKRAIIGRWKLDVRFLFRFWSLDIGICGLFIIWVLYIGALKVGTWNIGRFP